MHGVCRELATKFVDSFSDSFVEQSEHGVYVPPKISRSPSDIVREGFFDVPSVEVPLYFHWFAMEAYETKANMGEVIEVHCDGNIEKIKKSWMDDLMMTLQYDIPFKVPTIIQSLREEKLLLLLNGPGLWTGFYSIRRLYTRSILYNAAINFLQDAIMLTNLFIILMLMLWLFTVFMT